MIKLFALVLVTVAASAAAPLNCGGSNEQPDGPVNISAPVSAQ